MVVRSEKEKLLKELTKHGCVEVSEIADEIQGSELEGLLKHEDSKLMALKSRQAALNHAITLLNKYAPAKNKFLSAKPEVEGDVLLEESGIDAALSTAEFISSIDDKIKRVGAEESRQRGIVDSLVPWRELNLPLETAGTERASLLMGSVSVKVSLEEVEAALAESAQEAELFRVSADKSQNYILVLCIKESLQDVQECLRTFGFTAVSFGGLKGTALECTEKANEELRKLVDERISCENEIRDQAVRREELMLAADRISTSEAIAEAEDKLYGTESVVIMEGWMPEVNEEALAKIFDEYECAWETREPEEDEYPEVPVKLKNNAVTNSLNMVTEMYSLPAYGSVDPNPLMAPFFILFYGLMMADMGYGLIMVAAALVGMLKLKPRGTAKTFCQLLLYCGISTFVLGAITGGFFGDVPVVLAHTINPESTWTGLPSLFSPMKDSELVLYGAMVIGIIHLNTGMVINYVKKVKAGDAADAFFEEGALWIILVGGVMWGLSALGAVANASLAMIGKVVLIAGAVLLLFGSGRHSKGLIGKLGAAFGCVYNTLTGWFGDILSYSRIMALMLAGSVVAQVFNSIAVMPAQAMGVNVISVIIFIFIFLVGHALNFALNLLGCFVHDLRLQCLEFFGKFYEDGGKPFKPLEFKSKYVRAKEN